jgi:cell division protein FtsQ
LKKQAKNTVTRKTDKRAELQLSGIRATRPRVAPSKPAARQAQFKPAALVSAVAGLGLAVLVLVNIDVIGDYINRPVTKVRMENQWQWVQETDVRRVVGAYMGQGFFAFDVEALKQDLERHPWVGRAAVARVWPDSIAVRLEEKVAIARWQDEQLLSQQGEIFAPPITSAHAALPRLSGPKQSQIQVMRQYQLLNEVLFPAGLRLTGLDLSSRGSWQLEINDRINVVAGRERVLPRINRFITFYERRPASEQGEINSVDLRYENGLAVARSSDSPSGVAAR